MEYYELSLGNDTSLCAGTSLTLDVTEPGATYAWQDGSTSPKFTVEQEGEYQVRVSYPDGSCTLEENVYVIFDDCSSLLDMPNVFTPNGDGRNDAFFPQQTRFVLEPVMTIFNRWGDKVFETEDLEAGWNGERNGLLVPPGVYYWTVNYKDRNGDHHEETGSLTLVSF